MTCPAWWHELAAEADDTGARYTAAWYARFRDLHATRYPDADQCTRDNLQQLADSAALREGVLFGETA